MTGWQYRSVVVVSERNQQGFQAALDSYGEKRWELCALTPEESHIDPRLGGWTWNTTRYRVTFKRPTAQD